MENNVQVQIVWNIKIDGVEAFIYLIPKAISQPCSGLPDKTEIVFENYA